eukprot:ctg_1843.g447
MNLSLYVSRVTDVASSPNRHQPGGDATHAFAEACAHATLHGRSVVGVLSPPPTPEAHGVPPQDREGRARLLTPQQPSRHAPAFQLPPDYITVSLAGAVLVGVGLLMRSLGDVIGAEAQLPSAGSAKAQRIFGRNKRFLQRQNNKSGRRG